MGIDREVDGNFRIIAQVGQPAQGAGGEGEGQEEITVVEGTGKTISAAYDQLFEKVGSRPFLSHIRVIIIGEKLALNGVNRLVDFLQRDIRVRSNSVVLIGAGDLGEILQAQPPLNGSAALDIDESIRFNWERSRIFRKELYEMVRDLKEGDTELILPMISVVEEELIIRNAAYFENTTMKGTLDNREVLGYMWLNGDVRHGVITISPKQEEARYITFQLHETKVNINPVVQENGLVFYIDVDQDLRITDNQTNLTVSEMEDEVNEYIKYTILETINTAKEAGTDFIGFGRWYRRKYPNRWNEDNWPQQFQNSDVIIRVNSKVNAEIN